MMRRLAACSCLLTTTLLASCASQEDKLRAFERSFSLEGASNGVEAYYQLQGRFPLNLEEVNRLRLGLPNLPGHYEVQVKLGTDEESPTYERRVVVSVSDPRRGVAIRNHVYMGVGILEKDWICVGKLQRRKYGDLFLASSVAIEMRRHRTPDGRWMEPTKLLQLTDYDFDFKELDIRRMRFNEAVIQGERWQVIGLGSREFLFPKAGPRKKNSLLVRRK